MVKGYRHKAGAAKAEQNNVRKQRGKGWYSGMRECATQQSRIISMNDGKKVDTTVGTRYTTEQNNLRERW